MTLTLNKNYLKLLDTIQIIPKIIEKEAEYNKYLAVTKLIAKKDSRTLKKTALFRLLVKSIEDYEEKIYSLIVAAICDRTILFIIYLHSFSLIIHYL